MTRGAAMIIACLVVAACSSSGKHGGHSLDAVGSSYSVIAGAINAPVNLAGRATGVVVAEARGKPVRIYVDVAFITGRTASVDVLFVGVGRRIAANIRDGLVQVVAGRALHA